MTAANITEIFKSIYARGEWGIGSGPGSTNEFCAPLQEFLTEYIQKFAVRSLVDLGCGDLQWLPAVIERHNLKYTGIDCMPDLISRHKARHPEQLFSFICAELTPSLCSTLPDADLYFCKDVLQHWPNSLIIEFLTAFFSAHPAAKLLVVNDVGQRSFERSSVLGPTEPLDKDAPPLNMFYPRELFFWGGKSVLELKQPYTVRKPIDDADYTQMLAEYASQELEYPAARFSGRGIVICAGGSQYFTNAYVAVRVLRMHGCQLPVQFWHLGPDEINAEMRELVSAFNVECVDALELRKKYPVRTLNGWELKAFALLHCPFAEVLLLDADNVAARNPEYLFETQQYLETGAIFWPDYGRLGADRSIWRIVDVPYRDEPEFESGQILLNKQKSWKALNVAMHFNEWSDFYYRHIHGDKETFHMAWRKLAQPYSMPARGIHSLAGTMCQHDFEGNRVFQHRNMRKWQLAGPNSKVDDFQFESECFEFLNDLRRSWSIAPKSEISARFQELTRSIVSQRHYQYCRIGYDFRPIELLADGQISAGYGAVENTWTLGGNEITPKMFMWQGDDMLAELNFGGHGMLHGQWTRHEKMPIVLLPIDQSAPEIKERTALCRPRLRTYAPSAPRNLKSVVLTGFCGTLHEQMAELTVPRIEKYARKYNHDFLMCDLIGDRPASWYKVAALYQALQQYEQALWLDVDVVVARYDVDIFTKLNADTWHALVEHSADIGAVPNCGVWLLTRAMCPILEEIWTNGKYINHGWWEQAAIMEKLGYAPDLNAPRKIVDAELFEKTTFLSAAWNHHPREIKNVENPNFIHVTFYADRVAEMRRILESIV